MASRCERPPVPFQEFVEKRARDELVGSTWSGRSVDRFGESDCKERYQRVFVTGSDGRPIQLFSLTPYLQCLGQHRRIDFGTEDGWGKSADRRRSDGRFRESNQQDGPRDMHGQSQAMPPGQGWVARLVRLFGGKQKINFPVFVSGWLQWKKIPKWMMEWNSG